MSKKDFRRGLKAGRKAAARDIQGLADNFAIVKSNLGRLDDQDTLAALMLLRDAEDAALGNLDYRINKEKTNWKWLG